jgi:hypothetical protein
MEVAMKATVMFLFVVLALFVFVRFARAQEATEIPDAPMPSLIALNDATPSFSSSLDGMAAVTIVRPLVPSAKKPRGVRQLLTFGNMSYVALFSGSLVDSWGTYDNMTNDYLLCGYNPKNGPVSFSVDGYLPVGTTFPQLVELCGSGPGGQSANYLVNVASEEKLFTEGGWVVQLHLVDDRNLWGTIVINTAADVAQVIIPKLFHFRGRKKQIMEASNYSHGALRIWAGMENFGVVRRFGNPNRALAPRPAIDQAYPVAGGRWWAKKKLK